MDEPLTCLETMRRMSRRRRHIVPIKEGDWTTLHRYASPKRSRYPKEEAERTETSCDRTEECREGEDRLYGRSPGTRQGVNVLRKQMKRLKVDI